MLERASPVQLRKALELANLFVKTGVNFVPVPVANDEEQRALVEHALAKLAEFEQEADGAAAMVKEKCKRCDGRGLVHNSTPVRSTCPACHGTGNANSAITHEAEALGDEGAEEQKGGNDAS
jgi:predicted Zn-ribbon and HTH transcriptional regulator